MGSAAAPRDAAASNAAAAKSLTAPLLGSCGCSCGCLALRAGGLHLVGRDEAILVGVDLIEMRGKARVGLGFGLADLAVAVGVEFLEARGRPLRLLSIRGGSR